MFLTYGYYWDYQLSLTTFWTEELAQNDPVLGNQEMFLTYQNISYLNKFQDHFLGKKSNKKRLNFDTLPRMGLAH